MLLPWLVFFPLCQLFFCLSRSRSCSLNAFTCDYNKFIINTAVTSTVWVIRERKQIYYPLGLWKHLVIFEPCVLLSFVIWHMTCFPVMDMFLCESWQNDWIKKSSIVKCTECHVCNTWCNGKITSKFYWVKEKYITQLDNAKYPPTRENPSH